MKINHKITISIATLMILALALTIWSTNQRNIHCNGFTDNRMREICKSIETHQEFTMTGHAIISPHYQAGWKTVAKVWCDQKINIKDIDSLNGIKKLSSDSRLQITTDALLTLITGYEYGMAVNQNSILNPSNPNYLLKDGCK
jgi:hypothetical protein